MVYDFMLNKVIWINGFVRICACVRFSHITQHSTLHDQIGIYVSFVNFPFLVILIFRPFDFLFRTPPRCAFCPFCAFPSTRSKSSSMVFCVPQCVVFQSSVNCPIQFGRIVRGWFVRRYRFSSHLCDPMKLLFSLAHSQIFIWNFRFFKQQKNVRFVGSKQNDGNEMTNQIHICFWFRCLLFPTRKRTAKQLSFLIMINETQNATNKRK